MMCGYDALSSIVEGTITLVVFLPLVLVAVVYAVIFTVVEMWWRR